MGLHSHRRRDAGSGSIPKQKGQWSMTRKGSKAPNPNNGTVFSSDSVRALERWRNAHTVAPVVRLDKPTAEEKREKVYG